MGKIRDLGSLEELARVNRSPAGVRTSGQRVLLGRLCPGERAAAWLFTTPIDDEGVLARLDLEVDVAGVRSVAVGCELEMEDTSVCGLAHDAHEWPVSYS
jgi:hypothetical protein